MMDIREIENENGKEKALTEERKNEFSNIQKQNIHPSIRLNIEPIKQMQENMNVFAENLKRAFALSVPPAEQMQNLANNLKKVIAFSINTDLSQIADNIRKMAIGISDVIQKIKIPSISDEEKQQILKAYSIWGEYGWTINPNVGAESIFDGELPVDKKNADKLALRYCSKQQMEQVFEIIAKNKRVKKSDFNEAVFDYKNKQYKSCALILFSVIDSSLIRLQKRSTLGGKGRKVGRKAIEEARRRTEEEVNTELFFTAIFYSNFFACLEKMFESGNDFRRQPVVINRNFLDHGMLTRKITKKDCIQLFLLYYNLLELLDKIY